MRHLLHLSSIAIIAVLAGAASGAGEVIVGLNVASVSLYALPGCSAEVPVSLKKAQLSGPAVRVLKSNSVRLADDEEPVEMLEIELDGKRYCVPRGEVRLNTDVARSQRPVVANAPIGATRGLGENQR